MRQKIVVLIAALLALSLFAPATVAGADASTAADANQTECSYPIELTDATGEEIELEDEPDSVVALGASDVQTVYEIGAEDRLTGMAVEDATAHFEQGDRVDVTDNYAVNTERVIELDPDVVLAANIIPEETVETLRDNGLTVYHFEAASSIDDVRDNVAVTGELVGECAGAEETVDWMDERLEIVETAVESEDGDRPLAYYAMGEDGMTPGTDTFIHEILTTAGLENVAERAGIGFYEPISSETLVAEDPEWIIYPDDRDEPPIPNAAEETTAYQEDNVISVDANRISQPAPQVIYALVDIVEAVHPEAYEEASAGLEDVDENDSETDDTDDEDDTVPGFGIPVAVAAALAAVGLLARRR